MQYTITINQVKAQEWGLNSQQALLFAFVYEVPSWARPMQVEDGFFYALSKAKITEELPLLTTKADTAYRMLKALEVAGLIELSSTSRITLVRLTSKGQEWNKKVDGSEKYPSSDSAPRKNIRPTSDNSPAYLGEKSDLTSDKSPTNQDTNNQGTSQGTSQTLQPAASAVGVVVQSAPKVDIPADMPGPKDQGCKTFRTWANYAFAYRKRYTTWPVWNAKTAGQVGQLIKRLGADVSPAVAAYYLQINDARLINDCHSLGGLVAKAEGYHMQWQTGRQVNGTTARQLEQTQANINAAQAAGDSIRNRGSKPNAFL
jgi:hypothetical protein